MCTDHAQLYDTSTRNYGNSRHGYTMKTSSLPAYASETCRCSIITYEPRPGEHSDVDTTVI